MINNNPPVHFGLWLVVIAVVLMLLLAFEIWMIIDAALNKKLSDKAKAWWIAGMVLIHPFVAIAYFFTARRKNR